jgi:hypothetical protein
LSIAVTKAAIRGVTAFLRRSRVALIWAQEVIMVSSRPLFTRSSSSAPATRARRSASENFFPVLVSMAPTIRLKALSSKRFSIRPNLT